MPAIAKTTEVEIVAAARRLLESRGRDAFSMNDVALAVGVRTPSLYGRFADRSALLDAVELDLWHEARRRLVLPKRGGSPVQEPPPKPTRTAGSLKSNPEGYALLYRADAEQSPAGQAARAAAVANILPALTELVGAANALNAARVLIPFLHGFVSMELAGAFRLGGRLDEAFARGVATVLDGLALGANQRATKSEKSKSRRVMPSKARR